MISIEKLHFTEREVPELHARFDELRVTDSNDIYTWVNASLSQPTNARHKRAKVVEGEVGEPVQGGDEPDDMFSADVKIYLIYPATDLHIRKYTLQERVLIRETPELYQNVTLPYIRSIPEKRTAWVQNILDGVKEQDSVVLSDPDPSNGFVVVPDSKWDRLSVEALYLQVLCRNPAIGSLRDLRAEHIPLLKNIRKSVGAKVEELYQGVKREHLRMYIHYQPSYCGFLF